MHLIVMCSKLMNFKHLGQFPRNIFNGVREIYFHKDNNLMKYVHSYRSLCTAQRYEILDAALNPEKQMLKIITECGQILEYPWIWLRDNCQCASCFSPQLQSRTIDWRSFDIAVQPASLLNFKDALKINWSDNHESYFEMQWLWKRSFTEDNQEKWLNNTYRLPKIPWNAKTFPQILRKFDFQSVIESDNHLYDWLKTLAVYGVAIVENTPLTTDQLRKLASRISFIKQTHYGEEFEVHNKPDTTNVAYLSTPLQMHADLPYYEYKPGVNLLHCIQQTCGAGGENELTDCLHVSNKLQEKNPDAYRILSTTPVDWSDIGEEKGVKFFSLFRSPALCVDKKGELIRVNYSQQQRDSHFSVPFEDVIPWYRAHAIFTEELYSLENMVTLKTKPGDILTFDNIRLAHGRSGYTDTVNNERYLIGAYMDWDSIYSRIRVLQKELLV